MMLANSSSLGSSQSGDYGDQLRSASDHWCAPPQFEVLFDRFLVQKSIIFYRKPTPKHQNFLGRLRRPKKWDLLTKLLFVFYFAHPNYGALNQSEVINNNWAPQALFLILCVIVDWFLVQKSIIYRKLTSKFSWRGRKICFLIYFFKVFIFYDFAELWTNLKWSEAIEFSASAPQVIFWFLCSFWTIGSAKINHFLPKLTS